MILVPPSLLSIPLIPYEPVFNLPESIFTIKSAQFLTLEDNCSKLLSAFSLPVLNIENTPTNGSFCKLNLSFNRYIHMMDCYSNIISRNFIPNKLSDTYGSRLKFVPSAASIIQTRIKNAALYFCNQPSHLERSHELT